MQVNEPDIKAVGFGGFLRSMKELVSNERGNILMEPDVPKGEPGEEPEEPENPDPNPADPNDPDAVPGDPVEKVEEPSPDPRDEKISALEARLNEMVEKFQPKGEEQPDKKPNEPAKEPTPEEWGNIEKSWGVTTVQTKDAQGNPVSETHVNPRLLIKAVTERLTHVLTLARQYADEQVHGNTSDIRLESALSGMTKDARFTDIRQYSDAINKTLAERYHPKDRSNPKFIEAAYYEAKGRNQKNILKKAVNSGDKNKTIVKPAGGNAAPTSKANGRLTVATMTNEQRHLAEATFRDLPKEKAWAEYCKLF